MGRKPVSFTISSSNDYLFRTDLSGTLTLVTLYIYNKSTNLHKAHLLWFILGYRFIKSAIKAEFTQLCRCVSDSIDFNLDSIAFLGHLIFLQFPFTALGGL